MIKGLNKLFSFRPLKYFMFIGMMVFLAAVFIPSESFFASSLVRYAAHGTIIFFLLGLFFHIINQKWLMYGAFLTSVLLCLHLRAYPTLNNYLSAAGTETLAPSGTLNVVMLDLDEFQGDFQQLSETIKKAGEEILAFQGATQEQVGELKHYLSSAYPYSTTVYPSDKKGLGFFSKLNFHNIDTMVIQGEENLRVCVQFTDGECIHVINTRPAMDKGNAAYYEQISEWMEERQLPYIALGNFRLVSWNKSFMNFKREMAIHESMTSLHSINSSLQSFGWDYSLNPQIHILYSNRVKCTDFWNISLRQFPELRGAVGTYEFFKKQIHRSIVSHLEL